jgi:hypothetical protein
LGGLCRHGRGQQRPGAGQPLSEGAGYFFAEADVAASSMSLAASFGWDM